MDPLGWVSHFPFPRGDRFFRGRDFGLCQLRQAIALIIRCGYVQVHYLLARSSTTAFNSARRSFIRALSESVRYRPGRKLLLEIWQ
jgi:hypothetical protein